MRSSRRASAAAGLVAVAWLMPLAPFAQTEAPAAKSEAPAAAPEAATAAAVAASAAPTPTGSEVPAAGSASPALGLPAAGLTTPGPATSDVASPDQPLPSREPAAAPAGQGETRQPGSAPAVAESTAPAASSEPTASTESSAGPEPTVSTVPAESPEPTAATAAEPPVVPSTTELAPTAASTPPAAEPAPATVAPPVANRAAAPRGTLAPLVQPLWSDLTPAQQRVLQPFAAQWNTWPATEKRGWIALADRLPRMKPEDQARAQERIADWATLTPEQRRLARQNYRLARQLDPDERKAQWERYTQLTPEQQSVLRTSGSTSNTAARHAGARTGLAKEAAQPLPRPPRARSTTY